MKKFLLFSISFFLFISLQAQYSRYVVQLKDKAAGTASFTNPSAYLSQRAIDRRSRYNITIDSTDLPVPATYIQQIKNIPNVTVLNVSRWLNAVAIQTTDANAITAINALSFVKSTNGIAARAKDDADKFIETITPLSSNTSAKPAGTLSDFFNYGTSSYNEIHLHWGEFLHNIGLRGQGMEIAVLDGGFFNYTTLKSFDSININGQVLDTWDFVANHASVTEDNAHGMQCLSTIAANIPGEFIGKAPKANFHLYRTEDVTSEYPIEEFNWACGAEKADSIGADIISSSLGYGYGFSGGVPDYPYADLNGDITMSARAADLAAKKGLLVVNAAGNSGNDYWQKIVTPADADSVIAVAAVSTTGVVGAFSSYGPSADGRIKPDLASVGVAAMIQAANNTIVMSNGTSYACPNLAGLATCLWQGFPEFNNMQIIHAMKQSGSIYTTPNDRIGYGIPNLKNAFTKLLADFATSSATVTECTVTLNWTSKDIAAMKYEVERKTPDDADYIKIAAVLPEAGNTLKNHTYQFTNTLTNVNAGTVSYRIKQIVDTSLAAFTSVYIDTANIVADCASRSGKPVLSISPNPSVNNASLVIDTPDPIARVHIIIYDLNGIAVKEMYSSKAAGRAVISLPVEKLLAGKYIVTARDSSKLIGTTSLLKL